MVGGDPRYQNVTVLAFMRDSWGLSDRDRGSTMRP
jgi:hypothetical protein